MNGYNAPLFEEDNSSVSDSVKELNVMAEFLNNCNIMMFIMFGVLVVGGVILLLSKVITHSVMAKAN